MDYSLSPTGFVSLRTLLASYRQVLCCEALVFSEVHLPQFTFPPTLLLRSDPRSEVHCVNK